MKDELQNQNVIDLLNKRFELLRRLAEEKWSNNNNTYISNSEWSILDRIYKKEPTIAEVAKGVDFSRQATHKFIKGLEAKGLVEVCSVQFSKKHKAIRMTEFGEVSYEKNVLYKAEIEQQLVNSLGEVHVTNLKNILNLNWGIKHLKE